MIAMKRDLKIQFGSLTEIWDRLTGSRAAAGGDKPMLNLIPKRILALDEEKSVYFFQQKTCFDGRMKIKPVLSDIQKAENGPYILAVDPKLLYKRRLKFLPKNRHQSGRLRFPFQYGDG